MKKFTNIKEAAGIIIIPESDLRKLMSSKIFMTGLEDIINKSIKDIYNCPVGKQDDAAGLKAVGFKGIKIKYCVELLDILINGFNRYCRIKKSDSKQINVINPSRLFDYIWGFRKAIFVKSDNPHKDVQYFQVNVFRRLLHRDILTAPWMDLNKYTLP